MTEAPGNPRRGRPRTEGTRAAVVRALIALVAEQGFAKTSMDEVAERAGVSKATIYRRWPSKDALIIDAHRALLDATDAPDTGTLGGDLLALLDRVADMIEDGNIIGMMQASVGEMMANPELAEVFRQQVMEPRLEMFHAVFARAHERGDLRPGIDWRVMAYALIGSNVFRVAFMGEQPDREANRRLVEMIVQDAEVGREH